LIEQFQEPFNLFDDRIVAAGVEKALPVTPIEVVPAASASTPSMSKMTADPASCASARQCQFSRR
jgi:hypothetical protein